MSRAVVVNRFGGYFWIDRPKENTLDALFFEDYFKDRFNPTKEELGMFKMVTGFVPIVEEIW